MPPEDIQTTGLYNTDADIERFIVGEPHPRVKITPQGGLLQGDGLSPPVASSVRPGNTVVAIGDSVVSGGDSPSGLLVHRTATSWLGWASLLSDSKIGYLRNSGIPSEISTQWLARFNADVVVHAPRVCIIGGPTNDGAGGIPLATSISNVKAMVGLALAARIRTVLCTITPRSDVSGAARQQLESYNLWVRSYCLAQGIPLLDFHRTMIEPTTGAFKAGLTSDNVHPNEAGAKLLGQQVADLLSPLMTPWVPPLATASYADSRNLLANPLFLTDTDADGTANSWTKGGSDGALSIVTGDADINGNWQRITRNVTNGEVSCYQALAGGTWAVGDRLAVCSRVSWSLDATSGGMALQLIFFGGDTVGYAPLEAFKEGPVTNKIVYGEIVIPNGTYLINAYLIRRAGTGGSGWAQMAEPAIYNLTALGVG